MQPDLPHVVRIHPVTGRIARPWRGRDHQFQLTPGDLPGRGRAAPPLRLVEDYGTAVELVRAGHAIRMYDGHARPGFVAPRLLRIAPGPCANPETLWAYTLPDPPCTRDSLSTAVAAAERDHPALGKALPSGLPALATATYDSAFRQGGDLSLGADEFAQALAALAYWRAQGRSGTPEYAPLRQTLRCACLRAGLVRSELGATAAVLDVPLAAGLGELAGLGYTAARNSLSHAGLRAALDEDPAALLLWLDARRNFAPLRDCERHGLRQPARTPRSGRHIFALEQHKRIA